MKFIRKIPVLLPILLTVVACGSLKVKLFGPEKKDKEVGFGSSDIQGNWNFPCDKSVEFQRAVNVSRSLKIEGDTFERTDTIWEYGACDKIAYKKELKGTISARGSYKGVTRLANIAVDPVTITVYDENLVTVMNFIKQCGKSDWLLGQPVTTDNEDCRGFSVSGVRVNGFQMIAGKLQFIEVSGTNTKVSGGDLYSRP
jgi:hypothetical protein